MDGGNRAGCASGKASCRKKDTVAIKLFSKPLGETASLEITDKKKIILNISTCVYELENKNGKLVFIDASEAYSYGCAGYPGGSQTDMIPLANVSDKTKEQWLTSLKGIINNKQNIKYENILTTAYNGVLVSIKDEALREKLKLKE